MSGLSSSALLEPPCNYLLRGSKRSAGRDWPEPGVPDRVRVASGILAGLEGRVISAADPARWLVATEHSGLVLRVDPQMLEPVLPG